MIQAPSLPGLVVDRPRIDGVIVDAPRIQGVSFFYWHLVKVVMLQWNPGFMFCRQSQCFIL